jgi:hypothetical protein
VPSLLLLDACFYILTLSGYVVFTARDASRALATMNLKETESNVDDITDEQKTTLEGAFIFP